MPLGPGPSPTQVQLKQVGRDNATHRFGHRKEVNRIFNIIAIDVGEVCQENPDIAWRQEMN
jgi:hypothetical protein